MISTSYGTWPAVFGEFLGSKCGPPMNHAPYQKRERTRPALAILPCRKQFESAQAMLEKSASVGEVARVTGLTRQTYRIHIRHLSR